MALGARVYEAEANAKVTHGGVTWTYDRDARSAIEAACRQRPECWVLGCERCGIICTDSYKCKCCLLSKGARPYFDDDGKAHVRVTRARLFLNVTKVDAA
jgi:hypothetical protein